MVHSNYADEIDEITHTMHFSWRYNPPGEFGVLYLSVSAECAFQEKLKQAHGRLQDLPAQVVGAFRIRIKCLDLTDEKRRKNLGVTLQQLTSPTDFSVTQRLAREARKMGFEGIIAPSAASEDCYSLVVFKDKLKPPSYCILEPKSIHAYKPGQA